MTSLFSTLLAPILVLWIGAVVFYVLDRLVQPQDAGTAEAVVLLMAVGALLWGARLPEGLPYAELAFGEGLATGPALGAIVLRVDPLIKVLALVLLLAAAAASLASLAESGLLPLKVSRRQVRARGLISDPRIVGRAGRMAALGAALLLLFSGDWATMALAWVVCDLFLLYTRMAAAPGGAHLLDTRWAVALSLVGAVCLGLAAVVRPEEGGTPGALATGLALVAIVLRLLPWPLAAWPLPFSPRYTLLARTFSFLVPTLLSAHVASELVPWVWRVELAGHWLDSARGTVLAVWAAAALLVSAIKAWSAREPGRLIACTTLYGAALILMGCALNLPASWLRVIGVGAVLNVCALLIAWTQCPYLDVNDPRSWWRVAPVGVALLSLVGAPLTLGFPGRAALYVSLLTEGRWLVLPLLVVAEAGVLGALLRVLLDVECVLVDDEAEGETLIGETFSRPWQREVAYGAGAVLSLGILTLGIAPSLLGAPGVGSWFGLLNLPTWAALLLPVVGAALFYRDQERITAWMETWSPYVERLLDARWLYRGLDQVVRAVNSVVWNGSLVIEGAGYLAWVTLFGLVVLLLVLAQR